MRRVLVCFCFHSAMEIMNDDILIVEGNFGDDNDIVKINRFLRSITNKESYDDLIKNHLQSSDARRAYEQSQVLPIGLLDLFAAAADEKLIKLQSEVLDDIGFLMPIASDFQEADLRNHGNLRQKLLDRISSLSKEDLEKLKNKGDAVLSYFESTYPEGFQFALRLAKFFQEIDTQEYSSASVEYLPVWFVPFVWLFGAAVATMVTVFATSFFIGFTRFHNSSVGITRTCGSLADGGHSQHQRRPGRPRRPRRPRQSWTR